MEEIMLFISWVILFIGIILLILSPKWIYKKVIESPVKLTDEKIGELSDKKLNTLIDEKLAEKEMFLYYHIIAGITLMVIGFLLVLFFDGKLIIS